MQDPIEFAHMDWLKWAKRSRTHARAAWIGDFSTPFQVTRITAYLRPDVLSLVPFDTAGKSHEWNEDPELWGRAVVGLLNYKHAVVV